MGRIRKAPLAISGAVAAGDTAVVGGIAALCGVSGVPLGVTCGAVFVVSSFVVLSALAMCEAAAWADDMDGLR